MSEHTLSSASILALAIAFATPATASEAPPGFRIMSDREVAAHTLSMQALDGEARERYRDEQYRQLRQRALENGYRMPEVPPWREQTASRTDDGVTSVATTTQPADAQVDSAEAAAQRHAEMREKLQARRESLQQAAEADLARLQAQTSVQQEQVEARRQAETKQPEVSGKGETFDSVKPAAAPVPAVVQTPAAATPAFAPAPAEPAPPSTADATMPQAKLSNTPSPQAAVPAPGAPAETAVDDDPALAAPANAASSAALAAGAQSGPDALNSYRENMRSRFDAYMQERQAKRDEAMRLQREQREAALEKSRSQMNRNRQPYAYPSAPGYGPRYPAAFPGYRTPYWQQHQAPLPPQPPKPPQLPQQQSLQ